jgi:hypothetical protein
MACARCLHIFSNPEKMYIFAWHDAKGAITALELGKVTTCLCD